MSKKELWAYHPDVCDGDGCPNNCDICPLSAEAMAAHDDGYEPNDSQLEMGFDPYAGCYTYDC